MSGHQRLTVLNFYPRPPRGGRPALSACCFRGSLDFYPRPPRGGRHGSSMIIMQPNHFYPRPPRGGRRLLLQGFFQCPCISIHALREEGDSKISRAIPATTISIHALREEGDKFKGHRCDTSFNFYPRPPRGGRRDLLEDCLVKVRFLSTPSARRATGFSSVLFHYDFYFYPRPPRGGRRVRWFRRWKPLLFLSTPSARRATPSASRSMACSSVFLSTPSARRATNEQEDESSTLVFLSTPSARRATLCRSPSTALLLISIHALREEGDTDLRRG